MGPPAAAGGQGDVARTFFRAFPQLREDLLSGHPWAKGYYWVAIESHRQCRATSAYLQDNHERADLTPPMELQAGSD